MNLEVFGNDAGNIIATGVGNDTIYGGLGADRMSGSAGDDVYVVDSNRDVIIENEVGLDDEVHVFVSRWTLGAGTEHLVAFSGANCRLTGNRSDNVIIGYSGDDTIFGRSGNDTPDGWTGHDRLTGGMGDDVFAPGFSSLADSGDTITDFADDSDVILLFNGVFGAAGRGFGG